MVETEIWKSHPDIAGIEVSTMGNVQTLDTVISSEKYTRFQKGRVLNPGNDGGGYLKVDIKVNGKSTTKNIHRLVAQTFISNPENLPYVNHKDCDRTNNNVENLEFCTASYNNQYREKYGDAQGHPVFAINLSTLEVTHFCSQNETSRVLGVNVSSINEAIKGKRKMAGGYLFKEDNGNGIEIDNDKLKSIVDGMCFRGGVFAVNLNTLEISQFESQSEASRELGVDNSSIGKVIKGKYKSAGGFWFTSDDKNAADTIKRKLQEIKKNKIDTLHVS